MARYIEVNSCAGCPHRDHRGAFGAVAYVPVCRKANKTLPHTEHASERQRIVAYRDDREIPDWCPLPQLGGQSTPN